MINEKGHRKLSSSGASKGRMKEQMYNKVFIYSGIILLKTTDEYRHISLVSLTWGGPYLKNWAHLRWTHSMSGPGLEPASTGYETSNLPA